MSVSPSWRMETGASTRRLQCDTLYGDFLTHPRRIDLFFALVDDFCDTHLPGLDPAALDIEYFLDDGNHASIVRRRSGLAHVACFFS